MTEQTGKIALRREGMWWVAYWSHLDRHDIAVQSELARIRMNLAENDPAIKAAFIDLAKLVMTKGLEAVGASISHWEDPEPAPESERSGDA
jgi:hypothetical protein